MTNIYAIFFFISNNLHVNYLLATHIITGDSSLGPRHNFAQVFFYVFCNKVLFIIYFYYIYFLFA